MDCVASSFTPCHTPWLTAGRAACATALWHGFASSVAPTGSMAAPSESAMRQMTRGRRQVQVQLQVQARVTTLSSSSARWCSQSPRRDQRADESRPNNMCFEALHCVQKLLQQLLIQWCLVGILHRVGN